MGSGVGWAFSGGSESSCCSLVGRLRLMWDLSGLLRFVVFGSILLGLVCWSAVVDLGLVRCFSGVLSLGYLVPS